MNNKALLVLLGGLVVLGSFAVFVVDERERAMLLQFGEIKRSDYEPGIFFKLPFFQNVLKFDGRIQNLDSDPQLYLTSEKKNVRVDSFVKWRIDDVETYYKTTGGDTRRANSRLTDLIQKRLKDEFGKRTVNEVVSGERAKIMDILTVAAKEQAGALGIAIVDVRIKRVDLLEDVSSSVYQRMAAERQEIAKQFRSRGEEAARIIRARADKERVVVLAEAERDAQRLRGEGDGKAAEIYANAFNEDSEFYALYRSLEAYRASFSSPDDILLLEPNTEFFRYFKEDGGGQ